MNCCLILKRKIMTVRLHKLIREQWSQIIYVKQSFCSLTYIDDSSFWSVWLFRDFKDTSIWKQVVEHFINKNWTNQCFELRGSLKVRSHQTRMKCYAQMIYMLSQCKDNPAALFARMRRREWRKLRCANWAFDAPFAQIAWVEKSELWRIFASR